MARPVKVILEPVPVIPSGLIVQLPEGRSFNTAVPVAIVHSGCVTAPAVGAAGVAGCTLITISADTNEIHPTEFVTE